MTSGFRRRVLIVASCRGNYGGVEAFVLALGAYASKHPELEVKLCFKMAKGSALGASLQRRIEDEGVPYIIVDRASPALWELIGWADVVHAQNFPPDVVLMARLRGTRVCCTVHHWIRPGISLHKILWKLMQKLTHERWYVSNFVWRKWEPTRKLRNSQCIHSVSQLPGGFVPIDNRRGFVFAARWIDGKGVDVLVSAYALAALDQKAWPLRLMGEGPLRSRVHELIGSLGLSGVEILGFVDEEEKARRIRSARWLVAPPSLHEDLGLTPIEARSAAVPSIVTRDGGLPEAAGPYALICEPGDVVSLASCLRQAASMSEEEYERRSLGARDSLDDFLVPMSFYTNAYIGKCGAAH